MGLVELIRHISPIAPITPIRPTLYKTFATFRYLPLILYLRYFVLPIKFTPKLPDTPVPAGNWLCHLPTRKQNDPDE